MFTSLYGNGDSEKKVHFANYGGKRKQKHSTKIFQGLPHSEIAKVKCTILKKKCNRSKHPTNNKSHRCCLCNLGLCNLSLQAEEEAAGLGAPEGGTTCWGGPTLQRKARPCTCVLLRLWPGATPRTAYCQPTTFLGSTSFPKWGTELCLSLDPQRQTLRQAFVQKGFMMKYSQEKPEVG